MIRRVKIGTEVTIKSDIEVGVYNGVYFAEEMLQYRGQTFKVADCFKSNINPNILMIKLEGEGVNNWYWTLDFLEEIGEENMEEERFYCADCGEEVDSQDDLVYMDNEDKYVCRDCFENDYFECEDCGEIHHIEEGHFTGRYDDHCVCNNCYDDYYYCEDCGHTYHENEVEYNDEDDCYYCRDCVEEHSQVYGYHDFNDWEFYKTDSEEEPPFYIGHELEVENPNYDNSCKSYLYNHLNVVLMHDGSLDTGYEIISHPQSFNYIMANRDRYKEAFEKLISNGYKSHETDTCGLHFHVSRPFYNRIRELENNWSRTTEEDNELIELRNKQNDIIDRIILVMETYKEELIKFSRRKTSQLSRWAKFMSDSDRTPSGGIKSLYYIKKHKDTCDRYQALNLTNRATIEFRIFKGTLKYETFMASIELVNNIVEQCSDLSKPITDINWETITRGEFAPQYCIERDIHTDKVIIDNSEDEINKEKEMIKYVKDMTKDLLKIYNSELKRLEKKSIRVTTSPNVAARRLGDMYSDVSAFRDFVESIGNLVSILSNDTPDMDRVKYRLRELVNQDYNYRIMDYSLYTDIIEKFKLFANV